MRAIAAEPRGVSAPSPRSAPPARRFWLGLDSCGHARSLPCVFAVSLWHSNRQLEGSSGGAAQPLQRPAHATRSSCTGASSCLLAPDAVHVSLTPPKASKHPSATAIFSPSQRRMMFMASNLPPVPPGKAYELWVIPPQGAPVRPASSSPTSTAMPSMLDQPLPGACKPRPSRSPSRRKPAPTNQPRRS